MSRSSLQLAGIHPPAPAPTTITEKLTHALPLPIHLLSSGISATTSIATAVMAHMVDGPVRESWTLATTVAVAALRSVLVSNPPQARHAMPLVRAITSRVTIPFWAVNATGTPEKVVVSDSDALACMIRKALDLPYEDTITPADSVSSVETVSDLPDPQPRSIPAEWVTHSSLTVQELIDPAAPVILYLHGGAHIFLSPKSHRGLTSRLSQACRAKVLAVDYRLVPEHAFPSAVEDAVAAYCALIGYEFSTFSTRLASQPSSQTPINPSQILVMGDSSGGGLTMQLLLALRALRLPLPAASVLLSPLVDHAVSSSSWSRNFTTDYMAMDPAGLKWALQVYAGTIGTMHPIVSPVYADLRDLCPILIQAGEAEVLADDAKLLYHVARMAGTWCSLELYKDMYHVFQTFPTQPYTLSVAFDSIAEFASLALKSAHTRDAPRSTASFAKGQPLASSPTLPAPTATLLTCHNNITLIEPVSIGSDAPVFHTPAADAPRTPTAQVAGEYPRVVEILPAPPLPIESTEKSSMARPVAPKAIVRATSYARVLGLPPGMPSGAYPTDMVRQDSGFM
ncbi:alpha/beta hydrolase fold-domain-containing protein [Phlyctochytrium arcticum]|nr:alpha/beta hydrolase fold-domain-containing protein [Phlyctochytrium arcticum]